MADFFGVHERALMVYHERAKLLSGNLANADTPGFFAKDLDFKSILDESFEPEVINKTHENHVSDSINSVSDNNLKYRIPNQPSLDGNTVDTHIEKSEFIKNSIHYMASLQFVQHNAKQLLIAIKGD